MRGATCIDGKYFRLAIFIIGIRVWSIAGRLAGRELSLSRNYNWQVNYAVVAARCRGKKNRWKSTSISSKSSFNYRKIWLIATRNINRISQRLMIESFLIESKCLSSPFRIHHQYTREDIYIYFFKNVFGYRMLESLLRKMQGYTSKVFVILFLCRWQKL